MHLSMKRVCEAVLRLAAGKVRLVGNALDAIVNQPIEFTAPKSELVHWYASDQGGIEERVTEAVHLVKRWVVSLNTGQVH